MYAYVGASLVAQLVQNSPANAGDIRDAVSIPGSGRFPWRRKWQPTPVFLPGKFDGQRILAGDSPWGQKELDTTECAHTHASMHMYLYTFESL